MRSGEAAVAFGVQYRNARIANGTIVGETRARPGEHAMLHRSPLPIVHEYAELASLLHALDAHLSKAASVCQAARSWCEEPVHSRVAGTVDPNAAVLRALQPRRGETIVGRCDIIMCGTQQLSMVWTWCMPDRIAADICLQDNLPLCDLIAPHVAGKRVFHSRFRTFTGDDTPRHERSPITLDGSAVVLELRSLAHGTGGACCCVTWQKCFAALLGAGCRQSPH